MKVNEIHLSWGRQQPAQLTRKPLPARLDQDSTDIDILPGPHVIDPSGTDGFFLKVEAQEGFVDGLPSGSKRSGSS